MTLSLRILLILLALQLASTTARAADTAAKASELRGRYAKLSAEFAAAHPGWRPQPPASGSLLFIAPDEYSPLVPPTAAVSADRKAYAGSLFALATAAADAGQLSLAFQWATETLREDPNHAAARRVLGYDERDGQWLTPYGAKMHDAGKVWNPTHAWVAADFSPPAAGAPDPRGTKAHADIKSGWQVRTDHFLITTDHSLAAGAELAARLERLYQIWRQLFAGFYYSDKEVRDLFHGERNARVQARPFRVFYYRDKNEYVDNLRRRQPRIAETLGIYFDTFHEAHFFAPAPAPVATGATTAATAEPAVATLYHEAVHQLFQESKSTPRQIGNVANFWIVEGVATYFETLTEHRDADAGLYFTIGDKSTGRLPAARKNLASGFYMPLAELAKLNKDELQRHPEISKLYSQSSAMAALLIDGDSGRYHEPLVAYLQTIYAGRDDRDSLTTTTSASLEDLDAAYRSFMEK